MHPLLARCLVRVDHTLRTHTSGVYPHPTMGVQRLPNHSAETSIFFRSLPSFLHAARCVRNAKHVLYLLPPLQHHGSSPMCIARTAWRAACAPRCGGTPVWWFARAIAAHIRPLQRHYRWRPGRACTRNHTKYVRTATTPLCMSSLCWCMRVERARGVQSLCLLFCSALHAHLVRVQLSHLVRIIDVRQRHCWTRCLQIAMRVAQACTAHASGK